MRTCILIIAAVLALAPVAFAQQGPSPSAVALSINSAVANLAQHLEAANAQAAQAQAQIAELQKQLADLRKKCGKPCD